MADRLQSQTYRMSTRSAHEQRIFQSIKLFDSPEESDNVKTISELLVM